MLQRRTAFTQRKFCWRKDLYACLIGVKPIKIFADQKKPEMNSFELSWKNSTCFFVFCTINKKEIFYELKFSRKMKITMGLQLACFKGFSWGQNNFLFWNPRAFLCWRSCSHIETIPTQHVLHYIRHVLHGGYKRSATIIRLTVHSHVSILSGWLLTGFLLVSLLQSKTSWHTFSSRCQIPALGTTSRCWFKTLTSLKGLQIAWF